METISGSPKKRGLQNLSQSSNSALVHHSPESKLLIAESLRKKEICSDLWRKPLQIFSNFTDAAPQDNFGFHSHKLFSSTNLVVHNISPLVAISNTSSKKNSYIQILKADGSDTAPLVTIRTPSCKRLAWQNDLMISASMEGHIDFYVISNEDLPKSPQPITKLVTEEAKTTSRIGNLNPIFGIDNFYLPRWCSSLHIDRQMRVLATKGGMIHIWDLDEQQKRLFATGGLPPRHSFTSKFPSIVARWAPNTVTPHFLYASIDSSIELVDLRTSGDAKINSVISFSPSHTDIIRDIQWNPFVPFWFASAGEDGVVHVWDIRHKKEPLRTFSDHANRVNSISWAPLNSELLATASSDCTVKLWSLSNSPSYALATINGYNSGVIGCGWTWRTENNKMTQTLSTVASDGTFTNIRLADGFARRCFDKIAARDTSDAELSKIQELIHARDLTGWDVGLTLAAKFQAEGKKEKVESVLRICQEATTERFESYTAHIPERLFTMQKFNEDIEKYSWIPPHFFNFTNFKIEKRILNSLIFIRDSLVLDRFIENNEMRDALEFAAKTFHLSLRRQFESSSSATDPSATTAQKNSNSKEAPRSALSVAVSPSYLTSLFLRAMRSNFQMALEMAIGFGSVYESYEAGVDQFAPVAHLFLYPTIFEEIVPSLPPLAHVQITGFATELKPVVFELNNSEEEEMDGESNDDVKVQCEFDNWIEHPLTCIDEEEKIFTTTLYLPCGVHRYRFIVGGEIVLSSDETIVNDENGNPMANEREVKGNMTTQLNIMKEFYALLFKPDFMVDELIFYMQSHNNSPIPIVSFSIHKCYLKQLQYVELFDLYFIHGAELLRNIAKFSDVNNSPAYRELTNMMNSSSQRCIKFLKRKLKTSEIVATQPTQQNSLNPILSALYVSLNILQRAHKVYLPEHLIAVLPDTLESVIHSLDIQLELMIHTHPHHLVFAIKNIRTEIQLSCENCLEDQTALWKAKSDKLMRLLASTEKKAVRDIAAQSNPGSSHGHHHKREKSTRRTKTLSTANAAPPTLSSENSAFDATPLERDASHNAETLEPSQSTTSSPEKPGAIPDGVSMAKERRASVSVAGPHVLATASAEQASEHPGALIGGLLENSASATNAPPTPTILFHSAGGDAGASSSEMPALALDKLVFDSLQHSSVTISRLHFASPPSSASRRAMMDSDASAEQSLVASGASGSLSQRDKIHRARTTSFHARHGGILAHVGNMDSSASPKSTPGNSRRQSTEQGLNPSSAVTSGHLHAKLAQSLPGSSITDKEKLHVLLQSTPEKSLSHSASSALVSSSGMKVSPPKGKERSASFVKNSLSSSPSHVQSTATATTAASSTTTPLQHSNASASSRALVGDVAASGSGHEKISAHEIRVSDRDDGHEKEVEEKATNLVSVSSAKKEHRRHSASHHSKDKDKEGHSHSSGGDLATKIVSEKDVSKSESAKRRHSHAMKIDGTSEAGANEFDSVGKSSNKTLPTLSPIFAATNAKESPSASVSKSKGSKSKQPKGKESQEATPLASFGEDRDAKSAESGRSHSEVHSTVDAASGKGEKSTGERSGSEKDKTDKEKSLVGKLKSKTKRPSISLGKKSSDGESNNSVTPNNANG